MSSQTGISKTEPLIRTVKRAELSKNRIFLLRIVALVLAIVAGGLFLLCIGYNPFQVYGTIIYGVFRSGMAIQATVKIMIPLLITSLGVALAFKMQFWNIGAEGQIIMGAIFATYFALFHADWPHWLLLAVMFLAGMAGGGLWALLPAVFKVKFNTNETLFTLMLNYIALNLIVFFRDGPMGRSPVRRFSEDRHLRCQCAAEQSVRSAGRLDHRIGPGGGRLYLSAIYQTGL